MNTSLAKKMRSGTALVAIVAILIGYGFQGPASAKAPIPADGHIQMVPLNFADLAKTAKPGVVNISTVKIIKGGGPVFRHFFGNPFDGRDPSDRGNPRPEFFGPNQGGNQQREFKQRSLGSGFIFDSDGYIITNNHVVENADEITVKLADEREFDAKVIGRDPNTDLALIKIDGVKDLVPLKLGNSESIEVGSWVVAVGSPFGLEQTVTAGIVSAKGRVIGAGPYDDFIQTDASINPGNSGGPLLNLAGEVVGINTAIVARGQGIGFAIPINMAGEIVAQLKENGSVTRGWLGVGIQNLTPELAEYYGVDRKNGVLVTQVFDGDPAQRAGIRTRDVIVALNGDQVTSIRELTTKVAGISVGEKVDVTVLRGGKEKTFTAQIAKRQDDVSEIAQDDSESNEGLGLQVIEPTPESAKRFGHGESEKGVLVTAVNPGGKADKAGVLPGDLITEINRKPVESVQDLRAEVKSREPGGSFQLLVKRPNAGFVVIKIG